MEMGALITLFQNMCVAPLQEDGDGEVKILEEGGWSGEVCGEVVGERTKEVA